MADAEFQPGDGTDFAIRLLNTWDEFEPDPECLRDVGFVQRFMSRHGLTDAERAAGEEDIESLRSLRGRLSRAWDAANEEIAVAELNTILAGASAQPWLAATWAAPVRYDRPGLPIRAFGDALAFAGPAGGDRRGPLASVRPVRCRALPVRLHRPDAERGAPVLLPALCRPGGAPGVPGPPRRRLTSNPS